MAHLGAGKKSLTNPRVAGHCVDCPLRDDALSTGVIGIVTFKFVGEAIEGIDIALKAGGMQPVAFPPSPHIGISISPLGKIEPALLDDPHKLPDVILVTFEEFEAIAQRFKVELLKGTIVPTGEDEIPGLIRDLALKKKD